MSPFKITVWFESRADGELRTYSNDVPGLALSSMDGNAALADVTDGRRSLWFANRRAGAIS
jgi:hypothetical protein